MLALLVGALSPAIVSAQSIPDDYITDAMLKQSGDHILPRLDSLINNREYYIPDLICDGTDEVDKLNDAIEYCYNNGITTLVLPPRGVIGISEPIVWLPGINIISNSSPGFYNGLEWFSDTNDISNGTIRIRAISTFADAMIKYNNTGLTNELGGLLEGVLLDCNQKAKYGIWIGSPSLKESALEVNRVSIQGATGDGIYIQNTLVVKLRNLNISSCNGWALNGAYGFSDSIVENVYFHTCNAGGVRLGPGSVYVQFSGGKVEDNYGPAFYLDGTASSVKADISCIIHNNHGRAVHAVNGAYAIVRGKNIVGNCQALSGSNSISVFADTGATIHVYNTQISGSEYALGSANSGSIFASNNDLTGDTAATYSISGKVTNNRMNGVSQRINPGAVMQSDTIPANGSRTFSFPDFLSTVGGYTRLGVYELIVSTVQYGQAPGAGISAVYLLNYGSAGSSYGVGLREVLPINNTGWISGVSVALQGDHTTLDVTVNAGPSMGAVSGNTWVNVQLVDKGVNGYRYNTD